MKFLNSVLVLIIAAFLLNVGAATNSFAGGGGARGESFVKVKYLKAGALGSGGSATDELDCDVNQNLMSVEAGHVVESVDVVVLSAVTGSSPQVEIGDDDSATGYVADANVTEATPGTYLGAGSYVSSAKKYYSGAKTIKYHPGGTVSGGEFVVIIKGYKI